MSLYHYFILGRGGTAVYWLNHENMKDSAFRYRGNQAENYSEVVKNSS
jgi:hypothetical protein